MSTRPVFVKWRDAPEIATVALTTGPQWRRSRSKIPAGSVKFAFEHAGSYWDAERLGHQLHIGPASWQILRPRPRGFIRNLFDAQRGMSIEQWLDDNCQDYTLPDAARLIGYQYSSPLRRLSAVNPGRWVFKESQVGKPLYGAKYSLELLQKCYDMHRRDGKTWKTIAAEKDLVLSSLKSAVVANRMRGLITEPVEWPDEARIEQIGREGNDGLIYEALPSQYPVIEDEVNA